MPRKSHPLSSLIAYFQTGSLEEAKTTLGLVTEIVKNRTAAAPAPTKTAATKLTGKKRGRPRKNTAPDVAVPAE
jgi:hypothetical protein